MAEQREEPEGEAEEPVAQASAAAVALALGRTGRAGKGFDEEARAFLRDQRRLINLQSEHLHEQRDLQLAHLRVRRWKDRLSLTLQVMGVAVGAAIVLTLAAMAWRAHQDHSLVIEAFSAPPQLAQRGLAGEVLAADLMDRLGAITRVANASSFSASADVQADASEEIKVEIPETGVSIAQVWRLMRDWLGSERRISGDLRQGADGRLSLTARIAGADAFSVAGPEADLDKLEQQLAEKIFAATDPGNYAIYLDTQGRRVEAFAAAELNARTAPDRITRADAFSLWSNLTQDVHRRAELSAIALSINPRGMAGRYEAARGARDLGHDEAELAQLKQLLLEKDADQPRQHQGKGLNEMRAYARGVIAALAGDFATANEQFSLYLENPTDLARLSMRMAKHLARQHDLARARVKLAEGIAAGIGSPSQTMEVRYEIDAGAGSWTAAAADAAALVDGAEQALAKAGTPDEKAGISQTEAIVYRPSLAEGRARLGDMDGAAAAISLTPVDCYDCVRARGRIAAVEHDWPTAQRWFAEAARQAPSLPFAETDWGEALLAKGDLDGSIARLRQAHDKGPRFADPLELWGEALMRKGDFAAAAQKFAEADKAAPRWGRNQLHWGEALARQGRKDQAHAHFQAAAALDLSEADRAELARAQ